LTIVSTWLYFPIVKEDCGSASNLVDLENRRESEMIPYKPRTCTLYVVRVNRARFCRPDMHDIVVAMMCNAVSLAGRRYSVHDLIRETQTFGPSSHTISIIFHSSIRFDNCQEIKLRLRFKEQDEGRAWQIAGLQVRV